jgi:ribonuclease VapC
MVIDTSAILAVLLVEPDGERFARAIDKPGPKLIPSSVFLEASIVLLTRKGEPTFRELDEFVRNAAIKVVAFDEAQARMARDAYVKFGKGRHPAGLNFGDCISYALARLEAMPLLFKGDDFRLTDVEPAL